MYVPAGRERVEVDGHFGVFFVLNVDREAATVDLAPLDGNAYLLEDVPFSDLRPHKPEPVGTDRRSTNLVG